MESITRHTDTGAEKRPFDKNLCVEATKQAADGEIFDFYGDGVSLAEKFLPDEVLPGNQNGNVQLQSINGDLDQIKTNFSIESSTHEVVISNFGQEVFDEAKKTQFR